MNCNIAVQFVHQLEWHFGHAFAATTPRTTGARLVPRAVLCCAGAATPNPAAAPTAPLSAQSRKPPAHSPPGEVPCPLRRIKARWKAAARCHRPFKAYPTTCYQPRQGMQDPSGSRAPGTGALRGTWRGSLAGIFSGNLPILARYSWMCATRRSLSFREASAAREQRASRTNRVYDGARSTQGEGSRRVVRGKKPC